MKILLFKKGALGDVLMTTPMIRQLRDRYPEAQIDYLVGDSFKAVLDGNLNLNEVLTFDNRGLTRLNLSVIWNLVSRFRRRRYDVIFIFDKHWFFALLAWLFGTRRRVGFMRDWPSRLFLTDRVEYGPVQHEIIYYLQLLDVTNPVDYQDVKIDLAVNSKADAKIQQFILAQGLGSFVVAVNSGGDNPSEAGQVRKLPNELFSRLLNKLSTSHKVALVGGDNEGAYYQQFASDRIINFAGKLNIQESAALMRCAQRVYTTDCGPMHLAAAVNENITVYFGPTNPARKVPMAKNLEVFWNDQDIYKESYELRGETPKGKFFTKLQI